MNIKLTSLKLKNFKGVKSFEFSPSGENAAIYGQTGSGKTSTYDAIMWLLFDKDSAGRANFGVVPKADSGEIERDIVVSVAAVFDVDGKELTLRRELHEKLNRGELVGYTSRYFVNTAGVKCSQYTTRVSELIGDETTFRLLTDVHGFCRLHWTDQRKRLLDMAGDIGTPAGFEEITNQLNADVTVDVLKKNFSDQRKLSKSKMDDCVTRIDEVQGSLPEATPAADAEAVREQLKTALEKATEELSTLRENDRKKQEAETALIDAEKRLALRELEVVREAIPERPDYTSGIREQIQAEQNKIEALRKSEAEEKAALDGLVYSLNDIRWTLSRLRDERESLQNMACAPAECEILDCPLRVKAEATDREERLRTIDKEAPELLAKGKELKETITKQEEVVEGYPAAIKASSSRIEELRELHIAENAKEEADYRAMQKVDLSSFDFSIDLAHTKITAEVKELRSDIQGFSACDDAEAEAKCNKLREELRECDTILARADEIKRGTARIAELKKAQAEAAQAEAEAQRMLDRIAEYVEIESNAIASAVNAMFGGVKFVLFTRKLNGSIEPTCEAYFNGTPYLDCSTGEQILIGLEILNALTKHYELVPFLFVDNRECLTVTPERPYSGQTIDLIAQSGTVSLRAETLTRKEK